MNNFTEEDLRLAVADWRREYRKTMVLKAAWRIGLIILVCGSLLAFGYLVYR